MPYFEDKIQILKKSNTKLYKKNILKLTHYIVFDFKKEAHK